MTKRGMVYKMVYKRGLVTFFLALVLTLLLSFSVLATHQTVNIRVTPIESGPIFVSEEFDVNVLLSVPEEQIPEGQPGNPLYGATLNLFIEEDQIAYRGNAGSTTSDIFDGLESNELAPNGINWIMDGPTSTEAGTQFTLTMTPTRLGTIPLRATQVSGPGQLNINSFASSIVQDLSDGGEHLYTIAYTQDSITVHEHQCGDSFISGTEECDNGQANSDTTANACRTSCVNPSCGDGVVDNGEGCDDGNSANGDGCSPSCATEDADQDGVNDGLENAQCTATPTGFTVADNNVYATGDLAGCIIGDIDLNQLFNSNDISAFIFEYNHRDDGFVAAADLTQDTALNSNDISTFIFSYNHRP